MTHTFEVFHTPSTPFGLSASMKESFAAEPLPLSMYTKVAVVNATCVEEVFQLTNHIYSDWTENPEIQELPAGRAVRSTSVGDVVRDRLANTYFMVDRVGMRLLPEDFAMTATVED